MKAVKPSTINKWRADIGRALHWAVLDLQRTMEADPKEYTEPGDDGPSIDVRLCIDADGWILRHGSSDYDPYHSLICSASSVTPDTSADDLLEDLITQALDQSYDLKETE